MELQQGIDMLLVKSMLAADDLSVYPYATSICVSHALCISVVMNGIGKFCRKIDTMSVEWLKQFFS